MYVVHIQQFSYWEHFYCFRLFISGNKVIFIFPTVNTKSILSRLLHRADMRYFSALGRVVSVRKALVLLFSFRADKSVV